MDKVEFSHSSFTRRMEFLQFSPPSLTEQEVEAVVDTLHSNWITTGPKTKRFEEDFAAFLGAEDALGLNSCTAGLHLALATLNIGPGDEVITTPVTFAASVNVIEHVGATPILADVEPDTLNLNPMAVEAAITPKTRAIMPVHYTGHPVEMHPLLDLARLHDLYIIEDAAHAFPAEYKGQKIGTIGDLTSFSFYATKNLTTGEGGMLTGKPELIERARILSLHGMSKDAWKRYGREGSWYYEVVAPGYKYNMTDIQAALGLVQLARIEGLQTRRHEVVAHYNAAFGKLDQVDIPVTRDNVDHAHHLYVLRLKLDRLTIERAQFIEELKARNIGSSVHFIPIHLHPYYHKKYNWQPDDFPIAYYEYQRLVSLPLHPGLTDGDVQDVISAVKDIVDRFKC